MAPVPPGRKVTSHGGTQSGGFTLLEALLSIVLLTFVLGALYGSFFTVQRALDRFDGVTLKYQEIRNVLDAMRRETESAFLVHSGASFDSQGETSFIIKDRDILGKPASSLQLSSFTPRGSGTKSVSYYILEKELTLSLYKQEAPLFASSGTEPQQQQLDMLNLEMEMVEGIESFSVETLYRDDWIKTWDASETGTLPDLVRFSISFDDRGKIVKLTEYARPRAGKTL